ncbi:MAG: hypothetical protein AB4060_02965 [Crocosphaera sp.]
MAHDVGKVASSERVHSDGTDFIFNMGKAQRLRKIRKLNKQKNQELDLHRVVARTKLYRHQIAAIPDEVDGIKNFVDVGNYFYRLYGRGAVVIVPELNGMFSPGYVVFSFFRETQSTSRSLVRSYSPQNELVMSIDADLSFSSVDEWGAFQASLTILEKTDSYCTRAIF